MDAMTFSQASLLAFAACKRRFELRYLERLPWPDQPFTSAEEAAIKQGQAFHQLLERYFSGLPVNSSDLGDEKLRLWWRRFEENVLPLPKGRTLPELRLTVPAGGHFLIGRCDLVVVGGEEARPFIHIYDWKTSRPKTQEELAEEWQTRIYLALASASGEILLQNGVRMLPEQIKLTYWYTADPGTPRTIVYSAEQHQQNWSELEALIQEIETCFAADSWPLTDNWSHCRVCTYATYCGRYQTGSGVKMIAEDELEYDFDPIQFLEPDSP